MILLISLGGCGPTVVTVEDVILRPQTTRLIAHVERQPLFAIRRDFGLIPVTFEAGGKTLGSVKANLKGKAQLEVPTDQIPAGASTLQASAKTRGSPAGKARIFDWRDDRVIILVDIDETICDVSYSNVIFEPRDMKSNPIPGSIPALQALGKDFHVLYISARPRFLLEKSRIWIDDNGYPTGPVVGGPRVRDVVRQSSLKSGMVKDLQKYLPNILIGIGDKTADVKAYGKSKMLTLIYEPDGHRYPRGVLMFRDWQSIADFILANKAILMDADKTRLAIAGEIPLNGSPSERNPSPQAKVAGTSTDSTSRGSSLNSPPP